MKDDVCSTYFGEGPKQKKSLFDVLPIFIKGTVDGVVSQPAMSVNAQS